MAFKLLSPLVSGSENVIIDFSYTILRVSDSNPITQKEKKREEYFRSVYSNMLLFLFPDAIKAKYFVQDILAGKGTLLKNTDSGLASEFYI